LVGTAVTVVVSVQQVSRKIYVGKTMKKITMDPFTRIEGHLAVSLDIDRGKVVDAQCKGEMFRGFEQIMKGRSPVDAQQIMQRICGVCPVSHGLASVAAQEQAYGVEIPDNAKLIRNIMLAGNYIQNLITHFYHLSALDFMDTAAILEYSGSDRFLLHIKDWVREEYNSKKLYPAAPFMPRYEGRYLKGYEGNIELLKNYFTGLEMRAKAHQLVAIWAGKMPHMTTLVPGGLTEKVTSKKIALCLSKLDELRTFIETSYRQDLFAVADAFPHYFEQGKGCGNYISVGVFPDSASGRNLLPGGVILEGDFSELNVDHIKEEVRYSKYTQESGFGTTIPEPDKDGAYSWIKAPRYKGKPMEVGALARVMVAYRAGGNSAINKATDTYLHKSGLSIDSLDSCLGRHFARAIEIGEIIHHCEKWINMLDPRKPTCVDFALPSKAVGEGLIEAPRGALGHWLKVENKKVAGYECIVPTTWNCSPKDDAGTPGPLEMSLVGTEIADSKNPIEAARIVRAYDPCLACAVH